MSSDNATSPQEPAQPTKSPVRTCIGCRTRRPDHELIRTSLSEGDLVIDQRGLGRGAWLCPDKVCVAAAGKTKAFSRAFRSKLADGVCAGTLLCWLEKPAP